ncbi:MAG: tRNA (N(6)-L-threonylcarbamoyladenosine(37)-C(2))-methylthiotransferase MtaB [Anaerolineales bacterium]|jgi:threonylcarbamoyladenosine tRNA methylthiotransferase MtaB|nr:tRNA (N(6)-L-threonylcarbamoyladenosine(37)-C(2))-methylthiotransferase MtaB [Anaerolineales bacterium]MCC6987271.1 tRNA (N(6)-L-threonylcarbamoyladenosine(37)-C(2))-methylthiotransferase MtaB [Anaerolineales bacterium]
MKIFLDTVGCRLNQAEIESMSRQYRAAGHEIVATAETADMAVVNTCAVTIQAASDSRGKIRAIARAGVNEIAATGCWTSLQPKEAAALPNVRHVIGNDKKDSLVSQTLNLHPSTFDLEPISRIPIPGIHRRTRAFIKAQDGCDNACTFCVTTLARGAGRSRPLAEVIDDVNSALAGGSKEIVLTGVHLGSWGQEHGSHLRQLVEALLQNTDVQRLRLSSLEPWDLDQAFFSLWTDPRLMPHLHLPLQSGSDSTLRRMARKTTTRSFCELVRAARAVLPDVAITTDIIAGFPGETDEEFDHTLGFVREMDFAGGHVFSYSPRPGTGAARMKGQVGPELRKRRNRILQDTLDESAKSYRERFIGKTLPVLWESTTEYGGSGWRMEGWTGNYLRVGAFAPSPRWNEVDEVVLQNTDAGLFKGAIKVV